MKLLDIQRKYPDLNMKLHHTLTLGSGRYELQKEFNSIPE